MHFEIDSAKDHGDNIIDGKQRGKIRLKLWVVLE